MFTPQFIEDTSVSLFQRLELLTCPIDLSSLVAIKSLKCGSMFCFKFVERLIVLLLEILIDFGELIDFAGKFCLEGFHVSGVLGREVAELLGVLFAERISFLVALFKFTDLFSMFALDGLHISGVLRDKLIELLGVLFAERANLLVAFSELVDLLSMLALHGLHVRGVFR